MMMFVYPVLMLKMRTFIELFSANAFHHAQKFTASGAIHMMSAIIVSYY